jgi:hypothetical protein
MSKLVNNLMVLGRSDWLRNFNISSNGQTTRDETLCLDRSVPLEWIFRFILIDLPASEKCFKISKDNIDISVNAILVEKVTTAMPLTGKKYQLFI